MEPVFNIQANCEIREMFPEKSLEPPAKTRNTETQVDPPEHQTSVEI